MSHYLENLKSQKSAAELILVIAGFLLITAPMQAATIFLTNNTTPKTLASDESDAYAGTTTLSGGGTESNGLDNDKTGDSTVLTLSADDGGGAITFNSINVSDGKSLFMDSVSMGHGNEKWGANQNWTFTLDQTITFDALDFQNNENAYSLRSVAWKDDASASGTGWSFSSDGTIGIFSLTPGQIYDFTSAGVSTVAAGTEIGFGAFQPAGGGELLRSFTISPLAVRTWTGTGDWNSNPGNWTTTPPTSGDIATISSGTATIAESTTGSATSVNVGSGGTLIVNGGLTADSVAVDGVLGGIGTVTADVTIKTDGTLAPGNSPGTLTVDGALTLENDANEILDINSSQYDQTIVNGDLSFGGTVNLTINPESDFSDGTFTLFTYTGTLNGFDALNTFDVTYGGVGSKWSLQSPTFADTGSAITLTGISYIPEPSTMILAGLGLAGLMLRRRGRKDKKSAFNTPRSAGNLIVMALVGVAAVAFSIHSTNAEVILADAFADVGDAQKTGNTATFGSWDTVTGITAPTTSLSFFDGDDGTTAVAGFFEVTDGELDVNQNMDDGGWDTSIVLALSGYTREVDLTTLILDMRLTTGSGGDNTTNSKSGQMIAVLEGSVSGVLGTIDPGASSYPAVTYTRTLDLSSFPSLDTSETYTLYIQARGTGFGHHKSLQALELNGTLTIPEPSTAILAGLGLLGVTFRRRRRA